MIHLNLKAIECFELWIKDDEENPLLNDLTYETGADKKKSKTNMWYNKVIEYNWNFSVIKSKLIAIFLRLKEAFDFLKDVNDVNNEIMNNICYLHP